MNFFFLGRGGVESGDSSACPCLREVRETKGSPGTYQDPGSSEPRTSWSAQDSPPSLLTLVLLAFQGMLLLHCWVNVPLCSWNKEGLVPWMHLVCSFETFSSLSLWNHYGEGLLKQFSSPPGRACAGNCLAHRSRVCTNTEGLPSSPGDLRDPSRLLATWWWRSPHSSSFAFLSLLSNTSASEFISWAPGTSRCSS